MADRDKADSPDESAAAARPGAEGPTDQERGLTDDSLTESSLTGNSLSEDAGTEDALAKDDPDPVSDRPADDPHVAPVSAREPTLEELEQMLEGEDRENPDAAVTGADTKDAEGKGDEGDSDPELVSVGASPTSRRRSAGARALDKSENSGADKALDTIPDKKERQKKDRATPKQRQDVEKRKRTTPVGFVKESVGELRKVVYPTASQLGNYFVVVLVFVLVIIGFVGLLDLGFGWVIVKVFG